jgi:undecaprenyl-diphosphatase
MAAVAVAAAAVLIALGVLYAAGGSLGVLEAWVPTPTRLRPPWLDAALVVDFGGERLGAALLLGASVIGCLLLRHVRAALLAVAGVGLTVVTTTVLKPLVGRHIHGQYLSYPSGHAALVTALALAIALPTVGRIRAGPAVLVPLVLAAGGLAGATMAWSQVGLGAHYLTDTIGGFCTAVAVVPATAWAIDRAADRIAGANLRRAARRP